LLSARLRMPSYLCSARSCRTCAVAVAGAFDPHRGAHEFLLFAADCEVGAADGLEGGVALLVAKAAVAAGAATAVRCALLTPAVLSRRLRCGLCLRAGGAATTSACVEGPRKTPAGAGFVASLLTKSPAAAAITGRDRTRTVCQRAGGSSGDPWSGEQARHADSCGCEYLLAGGQLLP